jgi:hypothetical protein
MMTPHLQRRFDQLLRQAKDPQFEVLARELIYGARELVDTLLACGLLLPEEWKTYRAQIETTTLIVGAVELKRVTDVAART